MTPVGCHVFLTLAIVLACLMNARAEPVDWASLSADELIVKLASPTASDRAVAAQCLTQRPSSKAFDALRTILQNREESPDTLVHAIWAMQRTGDVRAAGVMEPLLLHDVDQVRADAAWALRPPYAGREAIPALRKALDDKTVGVRSRACESLGEFGDEGSVEGLLKRLEDENVGVRLEAVKALGLIGATNVADRVAQTRVEDDSQRVVVAKALLDLGDERSVDLLAAVSPVRAGQPNSPFAVLKFDPRNRPNNWRERFAEWVKVRRDGIENRRKTLFAQPEGTPGECGSAVACGGFHGVSKGSAWNSGNHRYPHKERSTDR
jgi:hypothetical protein